MFNKLQKMSKEINVENLGVSPACTKPPVVCCFLSDDCDDDAMDICADCDLPDACRDFGCAIKQGIRELPET